MAVKRVTFPITEERHAELKSIAKSHGVNFVDMMSDIVNQLPLEDPIMSQILDNVTRAKKHRQQLAEKLTETYSEAELERILKGL